MNMTLQGLVVTLLLLWSTGFMLRRQFPLTARRLQQRLADVCRVQGWQWLSQRLQPAEKMAAGCDNGCSSCSPACAADKAAPATEAPVRWRQPPTAGSCH